MYLPEHFRQTDRTTIFDFMERHSFATVVTVQDGEPFASHLPLLVDRDAGPHGMLVGHLALANSQHRQAAGQRVLVLFQGPHTYISPTWYAEPNVVPTWNYATIHAYGVWEPIDDQTSLKRIVRETVDVHECTMPQPWRLDEDAPLVDALLKQIVGFRIVIDRLEAKWKLNQNHSQVRRERVIAALEERNHGDDRAIAALMRST